MLKYASVGKNENLSTIRNSWIFSIGLLSSQFSDFGKLTGISFQKWEPIKDRREQPSILLAQSGKLWFYFIVYNSNMMPCDHD